MVPRALAKASKVNLGGVLSQSIFFSLFFAYIWLVIDTRLIYHTGGIITNFPVFFCDREFLNDFLSYPGGLLEYAAACASQFFHYAFSGAALLTAQAWLIYALTSGYLRQIGAKNLSCWIAFTAALLILAAYSQYIYHFHTALALLFALLLAAIYLRAARLKPPLALLAFLLLSLACYYLAAAALFVLTALCAIYEFFFERRRTISAIYLLTAAALPYLMGVLFFNVSARIAYTNLLPFFQRAVFQYSHRQMAIIFYALYLIVPLTAFLWALWCSLIEAAHSRPPRTKANISSRLADRQALKICAQALFLICLFAILLFIHDKKLKAVLAVDYYAAEGQWHNVLEAAQLSPQDPYVMHAVDRALYHTGCLTEHMFCYPQDKHALLLTGEDLAARHWRQFGVYLDMGAVNICLYPLIEAMENFGQHPYILKQIATVHMAKGETAAAKVYLHKLSETLFHANWAKRYLDLLDRDPLLPNDEQIQRIKHFMIADDYCYTSLAEDRMFARLLEKNKSNRMAFEYRMALHLLTGKLSEFAENLPLLKDLQYERIPRTYEEAILLHMSNTHTEVDLYGYAFTVDSCNRFEGFTKVYGSFDTKEAAMPELQRNYGDTYFFYYAYGFSGGKQ